MRLWSWWSWVETMHLIFKDVIFSQESIVHYFPKLLIRKLIFVFFSLKVALFCWKILIVKRRWKLICDNSCLTRCIETVLGFNDIFFENSWQSKRVKLCILEVVFLFFCLFDFLSIFIIFAAFLLQKFSFLRQRWPKLFTCFIVNFTQSKMIGC